MKKIAIIMVLLIFSTCICGNNVIKGDDMTVHDPVKNNNVTTWDCVYFGNYQQNRYKKDPIKWRVLKVYWPNEALIIADKVLDSKPYDVFNGEKTLDVTWEECTLRSWLNGYGATENIQNIDYTNDNFIDAAFSESEKAAINYAYVKNDSNETYRTEGGNDTLDRIRILSYYEAWHYGFGGFFQWTPSRMAEATEYAKYKGCWVYQDDDEKKDYYNNCRWWLRTPGQVAIMASCIDYNGKGHNSGHYVTREDIGVRPALWLDLKTDVWSYAGTVSDGVIEDQTTTEATNPPTSKRATPKIVNTKLARPSIKKVKSKKQSLRVVWKKADGIDGYNLQYSKNKKFKKTKMIAIKKASIISKTIKKLKSKMKYYVRIRSYKKIAGKIYYSKWSKVKFKKTK